MAIIFSIYLIYIRVLCLPAFIIIIITPSFLSLHIVDNHIYFTIIEEKEERHGIAMKIDDRTEHNIIQFICMLQQPCKWIHMPEEKTSKIQSIYQ